MAQVTQGLCDDLIRAYGVPNTGPDAAELTKTILSILSKSTSKRTNQFEINDRLEGLVEKCRILNKDPLGDALQTRLGELSTISNKWTPDVLSLLLELSDRPVQKTRVEDLVKLQAESLSTPLTWEEINQDDSLEDETAVWRDVDFTADSSEEDIDSTSTSSRATSDIDVPLRSWTEGSDPDLEVLIVAVDQKAFQTVSDARIWRGKTFNQDKREAPAVEDAYEVEEHFAIREVIFMLLGLPTSMFEMDGASNYRMSGNVQLCNVSREPVVSLLEDLLGLGQKLSTIRQWIKEQTDVPLEQSFRFALEARLKNFHTTLNTLQMRDSNYPDTAVTSLLAIHNEVCHSSRLIIRLYDVLEALGSIEEAQRPFDILQGFYSQICTSQEDGDDEGYEYMAQIFFECFQTYLKPILVWMETGCTDVQSRTMFIEKVDEGVSLQSLWQDQHRLLYNADGELQAPKFLHVSAKKIFNTGKSVDFLKKLGMDWPAQRSLPDTEPLLSYETVCRMTDPRNLSPFSEIFDKALSGWIASKYRSSSSHLRDQLESRCGLRRTLSALEYIYFYRNGALSSNVFFPLFERIDRAKKRWNDALSTTELFHEAFAMVDCIDLDCLSAGPTLAPGALFSKQRSMDILKSLSVSYTLPWPVANIIRSTSMPTYQRVFILLTQFSRAKYLLQRSKLRANASTTFYAVHNNLLWLVNTFLSHLTTLVIEVNTAQMRHELSKAEDVDAMIAVHEAYIARLDDQCFLTNQHASLYQAVISILDLAVLFSDVQDAQAGHTSGAQDPTISRSDPESSSDEESEATKSSSPTFHSKAQPEGRLTHIHNTYTQLLTIVTAAVEKISKADGGPIWEILAGNLAFAFVW